MATEIWVNIGSGNGLFPDGTKPLPEPMLTDHQWSPVTFILGQFHKRCLNHQSLKSIWKLHIQNFIQIFPGANELSKTLPSIAKHYNSSAAESKLWFIPEVGNTRSLTVWWISELLDWTTETRYYNDITFTLTVYKEDVLIIIQHFYEMYLILLEYSHLPLISFLHCWL